MNSINSIKYFLDKGMLRESIFYFEFLNDCDVNLFTRKMFEYKDRELLPDFFKDKIELIKVENLPIVITNLLILSEMKGDIVNIGFYLKKLRDLKYNEIFLSSAHNNDEVYKNYVNCLIKSFMIHDLYDFLNLKKTHKLYSFYLNIFNNLKKKYLLNSISLEDISLYIDCFIENNKIKIKNDTVVFKLPPSFNSLLLTDSENFYPLNIIKKISNNIKITFSPQFSMPGPGFSYPYVSSDFKCFFVDHHKYSDLPNNNFLHLKSTHKNDYMYVNNFGYSGWYKFDDYILNEENSELKNNFFEKFKNKWLSCEKPYNNSFGRYILIALQIQADSVQKKSNYDMIQMLSLVIKRFKDTDYNIVIRRHPKCKDKELNAYFESIKKLNNIHIVETPTVILIQYAEAIILCNSSVGWDAILSHKPLITFGESEYNIVSYNVRNDADFFEINMNEINKYTKYYVNFFYDFWNKKVVQTTDVPEFVNLAIKNHFLFE